MHFTHWHKEKHQDAEIHLPVTSCFIPPIFGHFSIANMQLLKNKNVIIKSVYNIYVYIFYLVDIYLIIIG